MATKRRITITMTTEQMEWAERQAILLGGEASVAEVVRRLIDERGGVDMTKPRPELTDVFQEPDFRAMKKTKATFLLAVARHFTPQAAAAACGMKLSKVNAWLLDEKFRDQVLEAQQARIALAESKLMAIAMGQDKKGDRAALEAILEARHPKYGRPKATLVRRGLQVWMNGFLKILHEVLGDTEAGRAQLQTICEKASDHLPNATKGLSD